jgi:hypothetical protein
MMGSNKHSKVHAERRGGKRPPRDDLVDNPGIGVSKGSRAAGEIPEDMAGESTFEGDVWNDTTPQGGVKPGQTGRTNK